jgi:isoleucyl-tRNA synthetase
VDLKDTLNLPKTDFPMRADLVKREPARIQNWSQTDVYNRIQKKNANGVPFVLHDGPPFTNGDVHVGTALNKILKDVIIRYKTMRGFRTPYIPGWDCHGLPIEHKVLRTLEQDKKKLDPLSLRKACAKYSVDFSHKQRGQFERLGILADWKNEYRTMDPEYEANILRTFGSFVEQGLVYRSKKPVYWSIPCKTALAEGELEYKPHTSSALWVAFSTEDPYALEIDKCVHFVIWTTTPWTLPANLALAVHPELQYAIVAYNDKHYCVAEKLAQEFIATCKLEGAKVVKTILGKKLEGLKARHPFIDQSSSIVLADYVAADTGTGIVHTAPGHGLDDYHTGIKYGLEAYSPIDDEGCYVNDGKIPAELVGISVLETDGKCPANIAVIQMLKHNEALVHSERYEHSYPHCWRSKTPVIFRAMDQWFISLDKDGLRDRVLKAVGTVNWIPATGENRIRGSVETRPDWCISRQRAWGTPLPVFYDETGEAYLDAEVIRNLANKIAQTGTDLWFSATAEELLNGINLPASWQGKQLRQGQDTMDVWIDSGASSVAVLKAKSELTFPADLYFEGSDQHRGWFQSSLWISVVANGVAPYKTIITHGFVVDEQRKKISKSGEKPQNAHDYVNQYGADILRLWISSEDYQTDVPLSDGILAQVSQTYRTIRNTMRFQLGNLCDFDHTKHAVAFKDMTPLDQWALDQTAQLIDAVTAAYDAYAFHRAYQLVNRFVGTTLSATYHDILKDRLYVSAKNSQERRSSQTAIHEIFHTLIRLLAPMIPFTCDEALAFHATGTELALDRAIQLEEWPIAHSEWAKSKASLEIEAILNLRETVHAALEPLRQDKKIGQSLDADVLILVRQGSEIETILKRHESALPEYFIVSRVTIESMAELSAPKATASPAKGLRCPRSWKWVDSLVNVPEHPEFGEVSARSCEALLAMSASK